MVNPDKKQNMPEQTEDKSGGKTFGNEPEVKEPKVPGQPNEYEVTNPKKMAEQTKVNPLKNPSAAV